MHEQVKITVEGDVLRALFSGAIGEDLLPLAAEMFRELAAACKEHGCTAILVDTRGIDLRIGRTGIYQAALALARVVASNIRVAAVVDEAHLPPDGIFAKLAGLAGSLVAVFTDEAAALAWLDRTRKRPTRRSEPDAADAPDDRGE
ncbi:MAG: hypothetical protein ACYTKD_21630 [Planctomycetota bacterium]